MVQKDQREGFVDVWSDPDDSLRKYLDEVDEIQAGRDPRKTAVVGLSSSELSVYDLCNLFLERQEARAKAGEVSNRHFSDCLKTCRMVMKHFGKFMRAAGLRTDDFKGLRQGFPATWGPITTANEIQRIRTLFKWAAESELIENVPNFGPDFKKPSRAATRRDQQQHQAVKGGKLDFTAAEIQTLLNASTGWVKASILLGINGGMENADCGRLSTTFLNLSSGWYDLAPHKT